MFRKKRLFLKYRGTAYLNSISRMLDGSLDRVLVALRRFPGTFERKS